MGIIFDIQRCSYHDGPGIRTTVFLKGCNLRCPWCHNPESFLVEPQLQYTSGNCNSTTMIGSPTILGSPTIVGREMSAQDVLQIVLKDIDYYITSGGGVTYSGGEPTKQPKFLLELLKLSKEHQLHTCLETNGYVRKPVLESIIPYVDLFLLDYKSEDPKVLSQIPGTGDGKLWFEALEYIQSMDKPVILRMPIIPGFNDYPEHFARAKSLKNKYSVVKKIEIMPYHLLGLDKWEQIGLEYSLKDLPAATPEQAAHWRSLITD
ncbi:MAG: radical SAM protein [Anaerolineaceae bacterium]|nr:MAG: radical SAM protein [Anaerolineaceae bacterium]